MRIAQIRKIDITNGIGIRVSLFTQGCDINCIGCFNSDIWDYSGGKIWTKEEKESFLNLCNKPEIKGISILGGEPLSHQNYDDLKDLFDSFKDRFPDKNIWMWTGRVFENLDSEQLEVVKLVDVLVDGPWIQEKSDFKLKYRGSSNQRIIDVKKSLDTNTVVTLDI